MWDYIILRYLRNLDKNKRKEMGGEFFFGHLFLSIFIFWVGEFFPDFVIFGFYSAMQLFLIFLLWSGCIRKIHTFTAEYVRG
jgi:hypothetical protein